MDEDLCRWLPAPDSHEQGLQNRIGCLAALQGPANDLARTQINHNGQICKALVGLDVSDVSYPNPVWVTNFKLPVQRVADRNRWLTTVPGGPTFIANLGFDPRQSGQACDPVRAAGLPLIPEVIVQLAIAIDRKSTRLNSSH